MFGTWFIFTMLVVAHDVYIHSLPGKILAWLKTRTVISSVAGGLYRCHKALKSEVERSHHNISQPNMTGGHNKYPSHRGNPTLSL